jgi:acetyl esterase
MPIDREFATVLEALEGIQPKPFHEMTPVESREFISMLTEPSETPVHSISERTVPGPAGDLLVRVYRPSAEPDLPLLVYLHGGGWVFGDLETLDDSCRRLASGAGCIAVSVDYRLAPEDPFPAPLDDAYAATAWVAEHAAELGGDASRLAIAGDSAGANLAAAVCLASRDRGGPALLAQLLVYPPTEYRFDRPSMIEHQDVGPLDIADIRWCWDHYLPRPEDREHPYATPMNADVRGLPRALVLTGELDPLRDDGEAYAERLREAGVEVELTRYPGVGHSFFDMAPAVAVGAQAVREAAQALKEIFTGTRAAQATT